MNGTWSGTSPRKKQESLMAKAAAVKAMGAKHTGVGMAQKRLEAARAAGQTHTGTGQRLRRRIRGAMHPDAKNVSWY